MTDHPQGPPSSRWSAPFNFMFSKPPDPVPDAPERGGVDAEQHAAMKQVHSTVNGAWSRDEVQALVDSRVAEARERWQRELEVWLGANHYSHGLSYAENLYQAGVAAREIDEEAEAFHASGMRKFALGAGVAAAVLAGVVLICKG